MDGLSPWPDAHTALGTDARDVVVAERFQRWRMGGLAALAGALLWAGKSVGILVSGYQPPVVLELALTLFALTVLALASGCTAKLGRAGQALGAFACLAGVVAVTTELTGEAWRPAPATSMVGAILGLTMVGLAFRRQPGTAGTAGNLALALGLSTIPALLVGGLLSMFGERLLEVSLLALAGTWACLGTVMLRAQDHEGLSAASLGPPFTSLVANDWTGRGGRAPREEPCGSARALLASLEIGSEVRQGRLHSSDVVGGGNTDWYVLCPDCHSGSIVFRRQLPGHRHRPCEGWVIGHEVHCLNDSLVGFDVNKANFDDIRVRRRLPGA